MPFTPLEPEQGSPARGTRPTSGIVARVALLLSLFGLALLLGVSTSIFDRVTPHGVHDWVHRAGVWAPAVYLAGFLLRPLSMVPLTLWLLAGGVAFGWLSGALYAVAGVNLGAGAVFLAARFLGRDLVRGLLGRRRALAAPRRWDSRLVLSLQLFPFMPHDLLNAAAGWSRIPYWRFLLGSAFGTLPAIILYTYAGSVLMAPGSGPFFVAFAALAALTCASLVLTRRQGTRGADPELLEAAAHEPRETDFSLPGRTR